MSEEISEAAKTAPGRPCYRCGEFVRMTPAASAGHPHHWTICPVCRAKLNIEASFVGTPAQSPVPVRALAG